MNKNKLKKKIFVKKMDNEETFDSSEIQLRDLNISSSITDILLKIFSYEPLNEMVSKMLNKEFSLKDILQIATILIVFVLLKVVPLAILYMSIITTDLTISQKLITSGILTIIYLLV